MDEKYAAKILNEECAGCMLCENAECTRACNKGVKVDKIIRSLYFSNEAGAKRTLGEDNLCAACTEKACMRACLKGRINRPVEIDKIMNLLSVKEAANGMNPEDVDLSIDFCGIHCENPFFLSSSIVGSNYEMISKAFDMGWAGVVYKTITSFPHKEVSPRFAVSDDACHGFSGFKNLEESSEHTLEENIDIMRRLKEKYPNKIVVASIMGENEDDWTYLAKELSKAGIDALECNFSCPHMAYDGLGTDVGEDNNLIEKYVKAIKRGSKLPLIAKMTANVTDIVSPAIASVKAGAESLAAINTIKSIMNVTEEFDTGAPYVNGKTSVSGYSGNAVHPIACRFIYDMAAAAELKSIPLSGIGGVESWKDAVDFILLGCTNVQVTTSVMQYGYRVIDDLISGTREYLAAKNVSSIRDIVGKALPNIVKPEELDRDTICFPKFDTSKCVGCGRCVTSCYDGGHQALKQADDGKIRMLPGKCVGCHLCMKVCPAGAIGIGPRVPQK